MNVAPLRTQTGRGLVQYCLHESLDAGGLIKVEQRIDSRDIDLQNTWNSGGAVSLSAGGNIALIGAQINSQGYSASAGGSYQERAAYDVKENVHIETTKRSGLGVYLADATNNTLAITTLGEQGGKSEKDRTETHIDSTRTAIVTDINAGAGAVNRSAGGDVLIEGSVIRGGQVNPLTAGGTVTAVAAVDTRHVEDSVFTSTIRWQSTKSTGRIEQTLHMPEIHGLPAHMSAYQGAGGVSVQLPAGSNVRTAIETLSQKPGQGYLRELGNRSDIDWQRVEELNKSLDFSKSGLTQEATIVVIIVVSILTYGAATSAGGAAATTVGASSTGAVAAGFTAGFSSLASTAAVSLINNKGDIGAVLKELGSSENAKGLLLTMATAGLTQGILGSIQLEGGGTLAGVDANSSMGQLLAKNAVQGISSAVLESAVMGTSLEDALKNNLQGALINTVAAQGADAIGDAKIDATSKALAHALLGCAMGAATAGSSSGCAPGATGAVIGEIVAGLYADASGYDQLKIDANKPGASAELKQQLAVVTNTMTELAKLTGAGGALLIGGDAETMQIAMGTAANVAVNNRQLHTNERALAQRLAAQSGGKFTVEQIEDALRNSGNSKRNETVVTGLVVNKNDPNGVYDSDAVFKDGSPGTNTNVQQLPNEGQVDAGLASFIQSNTGGESSPYAWSPGQLGQPPAPAAGQQPNGSSEVRYETRIVDGQAYTVPVVNCPAAGCASTDNVARFGLNAQDQATVAAYDNALDRQTAKGVGTILIGGVAVAATPVTLAGAVIGGASVGGAESVKDQVIDTGSVNAGQTITDTAVGAMVGVAAVGGVYVLGKFAGWVNGKPLVEFAGGRTALVNDAASVKPLCSQGATNSGVSGANGGTGVPAGPPIPANFANAGVGLRNDLSIQAGVPTSTSNVWGASLADLKQAFNTGGATITPGSARASSSGNSQILNVEGSSTGVVQVQYSPASTQSSHGGQYYKFTYADGAELKVIDPATYRVLCWPENGGKTTFQNPSGKVITYDPVSKTWR